jgi:hypothetical protein
VAVVLPQGHVKLEDIVEALVEEGTEFARETLVDIIGRYNRMSAKLAVSGYDVDTGLVYLRPVVRGVFYDKSYDPEKNSLYVLATQSKDIREAVAQTHVDVMGEAPSVMQILLVENMVTHAADGTITRGRNAQVNGSYIKIAGNHPDVGVYLVTVDGASTHHLPADSIVKNEPSSLLLFIPADIPTGDYRLRIVTQFSRQKLLTLPREATYHVPLTII